MAWRKGKKAKACRINISSPFKIILKAGTCPEFVHQG